MRVTDTVPRTSTNMTATSTVNGFFTLYLEIMTHSGYMIQYCSRNRASYCDRGVKILP